MPYADFIAAFMVGLLGAGHCLGMCGGVAAAVSFGTPTDKSKMPFLLFYNGGRLLSYSVIGAIGGGVVSGVIGISQMSQGLIWLRLAAAIMMILLALYIGQFWNGLSYVERIGKVLWRHISPLSSRFLPLRSPWAALPFGMIWGWLPCGLVYSALSWAAVSGNALHGLLIMLAFGLGTLPAMLLIGSFAEAAKKLLNNLIFRRFSSMILLMYGIVTAYSVYNQLY
ncbi:sulfite exporter TauE/SafE family protein [Enterovibrio makurazakiensis]|uniref:Sulfite exporter TauE/SafE family protein n=1 Tax=Enterovibrio gelatinilyticus TaxID=2899819 RepID=A0ABT5QUA5_9GAMM|nr:sulfite exporter TauE/SafE family protein [Enterovibrio sp. ZSDZ42]MDD1791598.1 sulfite exporter TauE/SafE family protein [Enterovibrio sp. ZSDZ42]